GAAAAPASSRRSDGARSDVSAQRKSRNAARAAGASSIAASNKSRNDCDFCMRIPALVTADNAFRRCNASCRHFGLEECAREASVAVDRAARHAEGLGGLLGSDAGGRTQI